MIMETCGVGCTQTQPAAAYVHAQTAATPLTPPATSSHAGDLMPLLSKTFATTSTPSDSGARVTLRQASYTLIPAAQHSANKVAAPFPLHALGCSHARFRPHTPCQRPHGMKMARCMLLPHHSTLTRS